MALDEVKNQPSTPPVSASQTASAEQIGPTPSHLALYWKSASKAYKRTVAVVTALGSISAAWYGADRYITAKIEAVTKPYRDLMAVTAAFHDARSEEALDALHTFLIGPDFSLLPLEAKAALCDDLLFAIANAREISGQSVADMAKLRDLIGGPDKIVETPWRGFQFAQYLLRTGQFVEAGDKFSGLTRDFRSLRDNTTASLCIRNRIYVALCRAQWADVQGCTDELLELKDTDYDRAALLHDVERLPRAEWWRRLENVDDHLENRRIKYCSDLRANLPHLPTTSSN